MRRLGQVVTICLGISFISFVLLHLTGDPVTVMLPLDAPEEEIALFRHKMGFDRPILVQYLTFLKNAARGDFGTSLFLERPATSLVLERFPASLLLVSCGFSVAMMIAIPLGIISALKNHTFIDNLCTSVAVMGQAMPLFWFALMMMIVFCIWLGWLPVSGYGTWKHLILPSVSMGVWMAPQTMRLTRSGMLDILSQDYVRTARAKGLSRRKVVVKHAFRNALIPVVTLVGMQFGFLVGAAVVTEMVFSWPGVASLLLNAIRTYDFPVVQASLVMLALFIISVNWAVDVIVTIIDPRIRDKRR
ncbi:MAG: ABC transporter permease subunit [Proteobacteria bacterium]|nr:ABC transporter permease subunit [Pseudomonadota bacterium]NIS72645.1 ABC transporter permease subunit [Pseudomonadota bacterium]